MTQTNQDMEARILEVAVTKNNLNRIIPKSTARDSKIIELKRAGYIDVIIQRNALGKNYIADIKITTAGLKRRAQIKAASSNSKT